MDLEIKQNLEKEAYRTNFKEIGAKIMKPTSEWNVKDFAKFLEIVELEKSE